MGIKVLSSLKGYKASYLSKDLISGVVVAALTIPISMGYAEVAGLPPVYGLYGSVLPALIYALFSSSPQLIFGVDAAAAAITGSVIAQAGIEAGSQEALQVVPVLALLTGLILVLLSFAHAGKILSYVSAPVMGGFITGVAISIMLTLVPKMLGGSAPGEEGLFGSLYSIATTLPSANLLAVALAAGSIAIILVCRKIMPKVPVPLLVLIASVVLTKQLGLESQGIIVLGDIPRGLPTFIVPQVDFGHITGMLGYSFTIAIVIMAESLLASNNFALKNHYRLDDDKELLAFGIANVASSFVGATPVSASVSRTAAADGYGAKTQLSALVSVACIVAVLFLTPYLYYLPMPVLSAIVFSALVSVVEADLAKRLYACNRSEFWIFVTACAGVLIAGIIAGVAIGVFLSFVVLLVRASNPPRGFLGTVPGRIGYFNMGRFPDARPIPGVVMYRFSSTLTFANARVFCDEVEDAVTDETKAVIIDASGIGEIDISAADRLDALAEGMQARGVAFYLCEQIPYVNSQLERYGAKHIEKGPEGGMAIEDALVDCGIDPYPGVPADLFGRVRDRVREGYERISDAAALGATVPDFDSDEAKRIAEQVRDALEDAGLGEEPGSSSAPSESGAPAESKRPSESGAAAEICAPPELGAAAESNASSPAGDTSKG